MVRSMSGGKQTRLASFSLQRNLGHQSHENIGHLKEGVKLVTMCVLLSRATQLHHGRVGAYFHVGATKNETRNYEQSLLVTTRRPTWVVADSTKIDETQDPGTEHSTVAENGWKTAHTVELTACASILLWHTLSFRWLAKALNSAISLSAWTTAAW